MEEELMNENFDENIENNSGQGPETIVPDEVANHFNWGAFLMSWIWGLGNKTYITLLIFLGSIIPFVNFIAPLGLCIWFGIEGNKWAWRNKRFESIEHFHSYQKKWATAGLILLILGILFYVAIFALIVPVLMTDTKALQNDAYSKMEVSRVKQAILMKEALEKTCDLSSEGLAKCFEEDYYNLESTEGNILYLTNGSVVEFTGDGYCEDEDACYVTIWTKDSDDESVVIPLYADENGYLYTDDDEENEDEE